MTATNHCANDATDLRIYKAYRMLERMRNDFTDARQQRIDAGDITGAQLLTATLRDCDTIESHLDDEARAFDSNHDTRAIRTIKLYAAAYDAVQKAGI